ncbi:MAG: hypothetical protein KGL37_12240 [Acidobacteriota bacterium]|nr:hypothetical protein [Acidobacteriota bacterium]
MSIDENESNFSVDQLLNHVGNIHLHDHNIWGKTIAIANAKLGIESNTLTKRTQELTEEQIKVSSRANELTEKILLSNEQASKDNKANAESMNEATKQLANSTRWLTIATFVLVFFAAIQAFIAFLALYKK